MAPRKVTAAAALAIPPTPPSTNLGTFDGRQVDRARIAVTNAGDGLSEALKVDPRLIELSEEVVIVLRCTVRKVRFEVTKDDELVRVHILGAGDAAFLDPADVAEALDAQRKRIEEAQGVQRLDFEDDGEGE